jgi:glycine/D-amino acid oxidase-like deaminating enzyme
MWPFGRNTVSAVRTSEPYWLMRNGIGDAREPREPATNYEIVIVGAGITGALVADALVGTGRKILVLDSREIAQASTAASTALLQYEYDVHVVALAKRLGAERATLAYRAGIATFAMLERRFPDVLAMSGYERRESLYLAENAAALPALREERAARAGIGIACEWLEGDELEKRYGCRRPGALLSALGAQLDPVRFTRALLAGCERHGVEIRTRSPVRSIEEAGDSLNVVLENSTIIRARDVVVCAGYEALRFLPGGVADLHNTFALVTEPVGRRAASLPLIWESARPYLYIRSTADGRLMVGGADVPYKSAAARDLLLPRQIRRVASGYRELFDADLPPIAYAWAGSFAETRDSLPLIGAVPGRHPRLRFALCYGGNGISFGVHAGEMIRAGIEGRAHPLDAVFGFDRPGAVVGREDGRGRARETVV